MAMKDDEQEVLAVGVESPAEEVASSGQLAETLEGQRAIRAGLGRRITRSGTGSGAGWDITRRTALASSLTYGQLNWNATMPRSCMVRNWPPYSVAKRSKRVMLPVSFMACHTSPGVTPGLIS